MQMPSHKPCLVSVRVPVLWALAALLLCTAAADARADYQSTNEARKVVAKAYRDILDRRPDREGLATYTGELMHGGKDEAWLRESLRNSPEYADLKSRKRSRFFGLAAGVADACLVIVFTITCRALDHFVSSRTGFT